MEPTSIAVVGPEGSGTNIVVDIVVKASGYPRSDPSALMLRKGKPLGEGLVHHISLPSHRPEVWWRKPVQPGMLVLGVIRSPINSIYSAWRRFSQLPLSSPSVRAYWENYAKAVGITAKITDFTILYEELIENPQQYLNILSVLLHKPPVSMGDLGITLTDRNGKYRKDGKFMKELSGLTTAPQGL